MDTNHNKWIKSITLEIHQNKAFESSSPILSRNIHVFHPIFTKKTREPIDFLPDVKISWYQKPLKQHQTFVTSTTQFNHHPSVDKQTRYNASNTAL